MINHDVLDCMNEAFDAQSHSILHYVTNQAWPSVVDATDEKAMVVIRESWALEEHFADEIYKHMESQGLTPVFNGTYRFASSRLNFARTSHLISILPPLITSEIELFQRLCDGEEGEWLEILSRIVAVKEEALQAIENAELAVKEETPAEDDGQEVAVVAAAAAEPSEGDDLPWRDPDMEIGDRMDAAKEAALEDKLWAAMAQTDCTACGYDCEGYAKAIATGEDDDLSKCVPGEDETAEMLAEILKV